MTQKHLLEELSDRYRIERELGRGGMAVVYLAQDERLDREVAIKVMRAAPDADQETIPRLLREARTVGKLQHPRIVQIYDIRTLEDDGLALIMAYVPGRNLKHLIRRGGQFSPRRTGEILVDVAEALQHAHERRLVHRDVKPENIHIHEETGRALLSDFGIARPWGASTTLTLQGAALGTPAYMSPEQIDGLELDGRTDVYSLGLVGYEMLAGEAPFAGDTLFRVLERQRNEMPPPLSEIRDDLPEELIRAIDGATQKHRDDRWSSAQEFAEHIRQATLPDRAPETTTPMPAADAPVDEDAATVVFRRPGVDLPAPEPGEVASSESDGPGQVDTPPAADTPIPTGSRKRSMPRPALTTPVPAPTPRTTGDSTPSESPGTARYADLDALVAVSSDLDFRDHMDLDPLLHCEKGSVRLTHLKCGGKLEIEPPQFERARRGKLRRVETDPEEEVWLVCRECDNRSEGIPLADLETALKKFLSRPIPSALEMYRLGNSSRLVPEGWVPPRRRRTPDRRRPEGRYDKDPSLLGKRRLGRDRRRNPHELDFPPEEHAGQDDATEEDGSE